MEVQTIFLIILYVVNGLLILGFGYLLYLLYNLLMVLKKGLDIKQKELALIESNNKSPENKVKIMEITKDSVNHN